MAGYRPAPPDLDARGMRFALVAARFNGAIVNGLVSGARDTLIRYGVRDDAIEIVQVPGAWELPLIVQQLASDGAHDAIIALGAVIRGDTPHFDFVAGECARGLAQVSLQHHVPVAFGVLTCDNLEQAQRRSGTGEGNKGAEAAVAAIEAARVIAELDGSR